MVNVEDDTFESVPCSLLPSETLVVRYITHHCHHLLYCTIGNSCYLLFHVILWSLYFMLGVT
jgi:hypothetical protein